MAVATFQLIDGTNGNYPTGGLDYAGGEKTFAMYATPAGNGFDGATIKLQASLDDGTTFIPLDDSEGAELSFTENSIFKINIGRCKLRFVVSGPSGNTEVTIKVS